MLADRVRVTLDLERTDLDAFGRLAAEESARTGKPITRAGVMRRVLHDYITRSMARRK